MSDHTRAVRLAATALDFDLAPEERAELELHRRDCVGCRQIDDAFRADAAALRRLPRRDAPSHLRLTVADAAWRKEEPHRSRTGLVLLVAAVLMLAMAIGGGIAAGQWLQRDDGATSAAPTLGPLSDLPLAEGPVSLLVDTDVAPDDLVAIAFLVAAPDVSIRAISVSGTGEVRCEAGVRIVLGLLDRLEAPQIPVACGREEPLALGHAFPDAFRENAERAAGLDLPISRRQVAPGSAVELIMSSVRDPEGQLRILTLGPLTNLAEAFEEDATLAAAVEAVYVMGGAVDVPGNVAGSPDAPSDNTAAEWNIYADPTAAQIVLDAGAQLFLVSLDGTSQVPVTPAFVDRVRSDATGSGLKVLAELFAKNSYMIGGDYYLWDSLAAIAAADYPIGEFTSVHLTVDETDGLTSGAMHRTDGAPNANYLSAIDASLVESLMISILNAD